MTQFPDFVIREVKRLVPSQTACSTRHRERKTLSALHSIPSVSLVELSSRGRRRRSSTWWVPWRCQARDLPGPASRARVEFSLRPYLGGHARTGRAAGCRLLFSSVKDPGLSMGRLPASSEELSEFNFRCRILPGGRGWGAGRMKSSFKCRHSLLTWD